MIVDAWGGDDSFRLGLLLGEWSGTLLGEGVANGRFAFFYMVSGEAFWSVRGNRKVVDAGGTTTLLALVFCIPRR